MPSHGLPEPLDSHYHPTMAEPPQPRTHPRRARAAFGSKLEIEKQQGSLLHKLDIGPERLAQSVLDRTGEPLRMKLESTSDRTQSMLLLGAGAFGMAALWAMLVLPLGLRPVLQHEISPVYVWAAAFFSVFAALYGAQRMLTPPAPAAPASGDHFGGYLRSQHDHGRWRMRILAAMGGVVHGMVYWALL